LPAVWAYEVSGMRIVDKWFNYRCASPRGRWSSELSSIHPGAWTVHLIDELRDLLAVLGRCVELEPAQAGLLERICAGRLVTLETLELRGVMPPPKSARKPVAPGKEKGMLF
jgi:hypothetical protein